LYALAFIEGFCVLAIQIGGTRLLAPAFGTSIFVWTSQIAITLIALAVGYIVAGKLSERYGSVRLLSLTLTTTTAWLAALPFVKVPILTPLLTLDPRLGVLLGAGALFGLPLLLLGGTSPILIKALVETVGESGKIAGRVFGVSTFGSVAGAMYLGFFGLGIHTTNQIMWGLSGLIGLCSLIALVLSRNPVPLSVLVLPFIAWWIPTIGLDQHRWTLVYSQPSAYGGLVVVESTDRGGRLRCLLNDGLPQNCVALDAETGTTRGALHTNRMALLAEAFGRTDGDALVIGSAAGVLPMYLADRGGRVDAVEINPAMLPLARTYFGFDSTRMRSIIVEDGRAIVRKLDGRYDLIILDAFVGDSYPSHLVTAEALRAIAQRLKPQGVMVTNLFGDLATDRGRMSFAAIAATFERSFSFNRFLSTPAIQRGPANFYVVSANTARSSPGPIPPPPGLTITHDDLDAIAFAMPIPDQPLRILTDAFNPIEHLDARTRQAARRIFMTQIRDLGLVLD
jgi:spermidine synthase